MIELDALVKRVEDEAPNIRTVYLSTNDGLLSSRFPAGTFGLFQVKGSLLPFKPYSTSTAPSDPDLGITIENVGPHSAEFSSVRPGDAVTIRGPFGSFSLPATAGSPILLIAGGIGITPIRSLIRQLASEKRALPVTLLQSATQPSRLLFHREFMELTGRWPSFSYVPTITLSDEQAWEGRRGRFTSQAIHEIVPDIAQYLCYICGAQDFVHDLRASIIAQGAAPGAIRTEQWVVDAQAKV